MALRFIRNATARARHAGLDEMKKYTLIALAVLVLFVIAFGDKLKDKPKIISARKFSAAPAPGGDMLRVSVKGREFDIDIYEYPDKDNELPDGNMTYAAAKRACESTGKRLCTNEEWTEACQGAALNDYSYGARFKKHVCNNIHVDRRAVRSGDFADCRSETGLYDMAGNLWEWVAPSKTGALQAKGGSYRDGELSQRCTFTFKLFPSQEPSLSFDNFGARCCRDVPAQGGE
jgi:hypothetical protein